jgi:hypothetical protein
MKRILRMSVGLGLLMMLVAAGALKLERDLYAGLRPEARAAAQRALAHLTAVGIQAPRPFRLQAYRGDGRWYVCLNPARRRPDTEVTVEVPDRGACRRIVW